MRVSGGCPPSQRYQVPLVILAVLCVFENAHAQLRFVQSTTKQSPVSQSQLPASSVVPTAHKPLASRESEAKEKKLVRKAPDTQFHVESVRPSEKKRDLNAPIVGEQNPDFYRANSASTIFQEKVQLNKKPELQFFNARYVQPKDEEILTPEQLAAEKSAQDPEAQLDTPEDILKAFGDPKENDKILALDNAPDSFKGMMAALQIGNEELAFDYARRYARRMRDLKARSVVGLGLIGNAMQAEGMLSKNSWADADMFAEQKRLREQQADQTQMLDAEQTRISNLDAKTRDFLRKAEEAEEMDGALTASAASSAEQNQPLTEAQERAQVRRNFAGKVPVDPRGEVQIYYFFRPFDPASLEMVPAIESLYRSIAKEGGVNFLASPVETITPDEISSYQTQTNSTFPIRNAGRLVREFQVKHVPTVIFYSPNTGKAVFEEGRRSFVYLDEIARLMRGK